MINAIRNSNMVWVLMTLITVLSFGYSIYSNIKNKRKKQLSYKIKVNYLIQKTNKLIKKINIFFEEEKIEDISATQIFIWNSGTEVIDKNDLYEKNMITISCNESNSFLEADIIKVSSKTNEISIKHVNKQLLCLSFNYLDISDGASIQLFHTGNGDDIKIEGTLKGGKIYNKAFKQNKPKKISNLFLVCITLFILMLKIICLGLSIYLSYICIKDFLLGDDILGIYGIIPAIILIPTICIEIVFSFILFKDERSLDVPKKIRFFE